MRKLTTEEFIERARKVHGDKYDYFRSVYNKSDDKVIIICPIHGEFEQRASNHMQGRGCRQCKSEKIGDIKRISKAEFLRRSIAKHGDRYDYSNIAYRDTKTEVAIGCPVHGQFQQLPGLHMAGYGCQKCGYDANKAKQIWNKEKFVKEARVLYGDVYNYDKSEYRGALEHLKITCPEHGDFVQKPAKHLGGQGCPDCGRLRQIEAARIDTAEFLSRAVATHEDQYDYTDTRYVDWDTPVVIRCRTHGKFKQLVANHLKGNGCPSCAETGFNPDKPGILYYIRIDTRNQTLYKIGITNNSVKRRFSGTDLGKITVIQTTKYDDGAAARDAELEILRRFREDRYHGQPLLNRVGTNEMFNRDVLGLDKSPSNHQK